jgi:hypothetical protein
LVLKSCPIHARAEAPPKEAAAEVTKKTAPRGLNREEIAVVELPAR